MTLTVTFKDHAEIREYWVNDGQFKRQIFLPHDSTDDDAIRLFNEFPSIIEENERLAEQERLKDENAQKELEEHLRQLEASE
tara:strand:+ start:2798 stop:3043 length:246 start_codon:yes stop_codon:yes gene_type:complete